MDPVANRVHLAAGRELTGCCVQRKHLRSGKSTLPLTLCTFRSARLELRARLPD